jgi:hypothetical protein
MASFTSAGDTLVLDIPNKGTTIDVAISGTYSMVIDLEREMGSVGSGSFELIKSYSTVNATVAESYVSANFNERIRFILTTDTSGTATVTLTDNDDKVKTKWTDQIGNTLMELADSGLILYKGVRHGVGHSAVVNTTVALSLTAVAHAGRIVTASHTTGFAITLPEAIGNGDVYTVFYDTTVGSGNHTIVAPSSDTSFIGGASISTNISGVTIICNSGDDTITMNGGTTGGLLGTWFRFTDVASGIFMLEGFLCATGTEADPFSAGV